MIYKMIDKSCKICYIKFTFYDTPDYLSLPINLFHKDKSTARVYPIEHDRFCYCDLQDVAHDV